MLRGDEVLCEASVRVAFISQGRARPIPKPLRIAMKADQEQDRLAMRMSRRLPNRATIARCAGLRTAAKDGALPLRAVPREGTTMHGRRPTISSTKGVVAAAHPLAAQAGARMLAQGGNAFDAAAATAAALNVVEPYMSGLAGAGLATCWVAAEKRVKVLDFVPRVPAKFPLERFTKREDLARGRSRSGVPGNLARLGRTRAGAREEAARRCAGSRDRAGARRLPAGRVQRRGDERERSRAEPYAFYGEFSRTYMGGADKVSIGRVPKQPDLARHVRAARGAKARNCSTAARSARRSSRISSRSAATWRWTISSRSRRRGKSRSPSTYRGRVVHVPPPPCEGFQFLLTLRILEGFDLARLERNGADHLDIVYRAIRLAAGVRINNNNPSPQKLAELLDEDHVATLRARVRDGRPVAGPTEQWMEPPPRRGPRSHTTSFSIARS